MFLIKKKVEQYSTFLKITFYDANDFVCDIFFSSFLYCVEDDDEKSQCNKNYAQDSRNSHRTKIETVSAQTFNPCSANSIKNQVICGNHSIMFKFDFEQEGEEYCKGRKVP